MRCWMLCCTRYTRDAHLDRRAAGTRNPKLTPSMQVGGFSSPTLALCYVGGGRACQVLLFAQCAAGPGPKAGRPAESRTTTSRQHIGAFAFSLGRGAPAARAAAAADPLGRRRACMPADGEAYFQAVWALEQSERGAGDVSTYLPKLVWTLEHVRARDGG